MRELANLLLAPEGSTLQDLLVEEASKLGDATVRQALRTALIDAPKGIAGPLGLTPPTALQQLLGSTPEDEKALKTARELTELLGPRVREQLGNGVADGQPSPELTATVQGALNTLLTDAGARNDAARNLQGVSALSRRVGAGMLRRAAERVSAAGVKDAIPLPDAARDALVSAPNAFADAIEPPIVERAVEAEPAAFTLGDIGRARDEVKRQ